MVQSTIIFQNALISETLLAPFQIINFLIVFVYLIILTLNSEQAKLYLKVINFLSSNSKQPRSSFTSDEIILCKIVSYMCNQACIYSHEGLHYPSPKWHFLIYCVKDSPVQASSVMHFNLCCLQNLMLYLLC